MIWIKAVLRCDECDTQYLITAESQYGVRRRDLETLRAHAASQAGWKRLRPKGQTSYGDYCGGCAAQIISSRHPQRPRYPSKGPPGK